MRKLASARGNFEPLKRVQRESLSPISERPDTFHRNDVLGVNAFLEKILTVLWADFSMLDLLIYSIGQYFLDLRTTVIGCRSGTEANRKFSLSTDDKVVEKKWREESWR